MPSPDNVPDAGALNTLGTAFTPSMLTAIYRPEQGWGEVAIVPRGPLHLDPATMALHYGQAVFEGVRAFRQVDGSWALFRAPRYAERLLHSCERMAIPPLEVEPMVDLWRRFVAHEAALQSLPEDSFYLRPLIFGCDPVFGDRPSSCYQLVVLGVRLLAGPRRPLRVLVTDRFVRAAPGGVGAAKVPGNYGAGMLARKVAQEHGCDQVLWLDAGRHRWVEELGSMNVMFVLSDVLVTPPVTDTILAGVTRDSLLTLAREAGIESDERPIALEEIIAAVGWKGLTEALACATAVQVVSIGSFQVGERRFELPSETPVADRLLRMLEDYEHGRTPDTHGWLTPV